MRVVKVFEGVSAAATAGVAVGDRLLSVDGADCSRRSARPRPTPHAAPGARLGPVDQPRHSLRQKAQRALLGFLLCPGSGPGRWRERGRGRLTGCGAGGRGRAGLPEIGRRLCDTNAVREVCEIKMAKPPAKEGLPGREYLVQLERRWVNDPDAVAARTRAVEAEAIEYLQNWQP